MSEPKVLYSEQGGVATITLNRAGASNALDLETARALNQAVDRAATDDAVRVVLVTGDGPRFCAGGDVASMSSAENPADYVLELASSVDQALRELAAMAKPVVAAVQGAAAGAGLAVVLSADVVLSATSTKYLTAYAGVGLTPDCGLSWLLPRAVGQQRALELALTGRVLSADEARDWGLVTTVVPDDELGQRTDDLVAKLAAAPPYALGQAKRLIRSSWAATRAETGADEARTISAAAQTAEAQELIARFLSR